MKLNFLRYLRLINRVLNRFFSDPKALILDMERYMSRKDWGTLQGNGSQLISNLGDSLPNVVPLSFVIDPSLSKQPRLNVLIPGMAMKAMSGGPNTAINLTYRLAAHKIPIRYISTDIPMDENHEPLWQHFSSLTGIKERFDHVEIACGYDRSVPLPIGENDVFFGTAWWTVQMIKYALHQTKVKQFIYMIQEYEPGLYSWSTLYALALETYGLNFRGVINESLLAKYLCQNKIGRFAEPDFINKCTVFDPAVDRERFHPNQMSQSSTRVKRLLFYARPNAPRNLYELGILALKKAVEQGAFPSQEWDLRFIGEKLPSIDLGKGVVICQQPWLDYNNYADLLRNSDIGLSLMLSPHTSYPPLEMASCGALVVTNTFTVKSKEELCSISNNIIPVEPQLESIVEGLIEAYERSKNLEKRFADSHNNLPSTWNNSFNDTVNALLEMWQNCLHNS